MTKIILASLALFSSFLFVSADSYDGPFCFEPATYSDDSSKFGSPDEKNIRGTCKKIEFARIISLDHSVSDYHFVTWPMENPFSGERESRTATTSRSIQDEPWSSLYLKRTIVYEDNSDNGLIPVWYMASENPFNLQDAETSNTNNTSSLFVNHYGRATFYPYSREGKLGTATYVPVTSPITKVIEYWRIAKMPNGFILIKDKTETYLDNGEVKTIIKSQPVATTTKAPIEEKKGFFSKLASFFQNLF